MSRTVTGVLLFLFLLVGSLTIGFSLAPLPAGIYEADEADLLRSSIDRWFGVPSTAIVWPGGGVQMLTQALIVGSYLLAHPSLSISGFGDFLAGLHHDPRALLIAVRTTLAAINLLSPVLAFLAARRLGCTPFSAALLALIWSFGPVILRGHMQATADGLSWTLAQLSVYLAMLGGGWGFAAGLSFGLAVGTKVTCLTLLVTIVLLQATRSDRPLPATASLLAGVCLGFLVACPQIWYDPFRLVKGTVGTFLATGYAPEVAPVNDAVRWSFLVLLLPCLRFAFRPSEHRRLAVSLLAGGLVGLVPIFAGHFGYLRYIVPVAIPVTILVARSIDDLADALGPRGWLPVRVAAAALAVALSGVGLRGMAPYWTGPAMSEMVRQLESCRTGKTLLLPDTFPLVVVDPLPISRESWTEMAQRAVANAAGSDAAARYLTARNLDPVMVRLFWPALTEREQAQRVRLTAFAEKARPDDCPAHIYRLDGRAGAVGLAAARNAMVSLTQAEAFRRFADHPAAYLLVTTAGARAELQAVIGGPASPRIGDAGDRVSRFYLFGGDDKP